MEGSDRMRSALLVLLVALLVVVEGRNMPGQADLQPQHFGSVGGDPGMGGMPSIVHGLPGIGMLNPPGSLSNPPAFGLGFLNPPVLGGWPGMLNPPGLGPRGGGFSILNPPRVSEPVAFPGFGGIPGIVGTIPQPTLIGSEQAGKGSP